jgi:hypothetical protein
MIMHLLKSIRLLEFIEKSSQDTLWFQRQMLKKKYQDKKQDQSYKPSQNVSPPVKTRLAKSANSNLIPFEPKNYGIRNIKKA